MKRMLPRRRTPSDWERIRALFRERRTSYDAAEAPALIGIPPETLQKELGTIDGSALAWEDVIALGLDRRWTPRMLTEALRRRGLAALPPLVRTVAGRVVLPRYQWQLLRFLAADRARAERREITASDLLEEAVSTALLTQDYDWKRIEAALPGVRAAVDWPSNE